MKLFLLNNPSSLVSTTFIASSMSPYIFIICVEILQMMEIGRDDCRPKSNGGQVHLSYQYKMHNVAIYDRISSFSFSSPTSHIFSAWLKPTA
jgi:hypothetical protein